jgi:hypothetical protein
MFGRQKAIISPNNICKEAEYFNIPHELFRFFRLRIFRLNSVFFASNFRLLRVPSIFTHFWTSLPLHSSVLLFDSTSKFHFRSLSDSPQLLPRSFAFTLHFFRTFECKLTLTLLSISIPSSMRTLAISFAIRPPTTDSLKKLFFLSHLFLFLLFLCSNYSFASFAAEMQFHRKPQTGHWQQTFHPSLDPSSLPFSIYSPFIRLTWKISPFIFSHRLFLLPTNPIFSVLFVLLDFRFTSKIRTRRNFPARFKQRNLTKTMQRLLKWAPN